MRKLLMHDRLPRKKKKKMKQTLGENAYRNIAKDFSRIYMYRCTTNFEYYDKIGLKSYMREGDNAIMIKYPYGCRHINDMVEFDKKTAQENFVLIRKIKGPTHKQRKQINNKYE